MHIEYGTVLTLGGAEAGRGARRAAAALERRVVLRRWGRVGGRPEFFQRAVFIVCVKYLNKI